MVKSKPWKITQPQNDNLADGAGIPERISKQILLYKKNEIEESLQEYLLAPNPLTLRDAAAGIVDIYRKLRPILTHDTKLKEKVWKKLEPLDNYLITLPQPFKLDPQEWSNYFMTICDVLHILKLTDFRIISDADDDFAGVSGMEEGRSVLKEWIKNGFKPPKE